MDHVNIAMTNCIAVNTDMTVKAFVALVSTPEK